jgi:hypothetical protein
MMGLDRHCEGEKSAMEDDEWMREIEWERDIVEWCFRMNVIEETTQSKNLPRFIY